MSFCKLLSYRQLTTTTTRNSKQSYSLPRISTVVCCMCCLCINKIAVAASSRFYQERMKPASMADQTLKFWVQFLIRQNVNVEPWNLPSYVPDRTFVRSMIVLLDRELYVLLWFQTPLTYELLQLVPSFCND